MSSQLHKQLIISCVSRIKISCDAAKLVDFTKKYNSLPILYILCILFLPIFAAMLIQKDGGTGPYDVLATVSSHQ